MINVYLSKLMCFNSQWFILKTSLDPVAHLQDGFRKNMSGGEKDCFA